MKEVIEKKAEDTLAKMGLTDVAEKTDVADQTKVEVAKNPKQYEIIMDEQDNWDLNKPVKGGVNGVAFQIPRGKPVVVSAGVVNVLNNAVMTLYEPNTGRPRKVRRFAFSILREIY